MCMPQLSSCVWRESSCPTSACCWRRRTCSAGDCSRRPARAASPWRHPTTSTYSCPDEDVVHRVPNLTLFYSAVCLCACRYCCKVLQSIPPVVNGLSEHLDNTNWCKGYSLQQSSLVCTHAHKADCLHCCDLQSPPPPPPNTMCVGNKAVCCH